MSHGDQAAEVGHEVPRLRLEPRGEECCSRRQETVGTGRVNSRAKGRRPLPKVFAEEPPLHLPADRDDIFLSVLARAGFLDAQEAKEVELDGDVIHELVRARFETEGPVVGGYQSDPVDGPGFVERFMRSSLVRLRDLPRFPAESCPPSVGGLELRARIRQHALESVEETQRRVSEARTSTERQAYTIRFERPLGDPARAGSAQGLADQAVERAASRADVAGSRRWGRFLSPRRVRSTLLSALIFSLESRHTRVADIGIPFMTGGRPWAILRPPPSCPCHESLVDKRVRRPPPQ